MTGRTITVRRVYEPGAPGDGTRILVDRLWPRGLAKASAEIDEWVKDVAPSTELRKWYAHDPAKFDEFGRRYRRELVDAPARDAVERLRALADAGPLTLLTGTGDVAHSNAAVLAELLTRP